jgi:hypothetical protein
MNPSMRVTMTNCVSCEKAIPLNSGICPYCGRLQGGPADSGRARTKLIVAIVLSIAVLVLWTSFFGPAQP